MKNFLLLLVAVVMAGYWLQSKSVAQKNVIDDLAEIICGVDVPGRVQWALDSMKADHEKLTASGGLGLAFQDQLKKENLSFMRTVSGEMCALRPTFHKDIDSIRFESEQKKDHLVDLAIQRAMKNCPEKTANTDALKDSLNTFLKYYAKVLYS